MAIGTGAAILGAAGIGAVAQGAAANRATDAQVSANEDVRAFIERGSRRAQNQINQGARGAQQAIRNGTSGAIDALRNGYQQQNALLRPMIQSGRRSQKVVDYLNGVGNQPGWYDGIEATDSYNFIRDETLSGVENSAAARGGLYSGATMKALQDRATGLASQFENTYYNRLAGQAGQGASAANALAAYAGQRAGGISGLRAGQGVNIGNIRNNRGVAIANALMGQASGLSNAATSTGNALAAGAIAQGNAISDGINNGLGGYMWANQQGGNKAYAKGFV